LVLLTASCSRVDRISDAAAAASAALREERATGHRLGLTFEAIADAPDRASMLETRLLPDYEAYVKAVDQAIVRMEELDALEPERETQDALTLLRARSRGYHDAYVGLAALRGRSSADVAAQLRLIAESLLRVP
jgi:hypothetical protein